ncbi:UNVERIFIED_CONTAM: hypothetical protein H355_003053 [Colinus virginianus]|nr:hypothetical protein H355_003053 [Colinus virginianus]
MPGAGSGHARGAELSAESQQRPALVTGHAERGYYLSASHALLISLDHCIFNGATTLTDKAYLLFLFSCVVADEKLKNAMWMSHIKSNCVMFCYTLERHEVMVTGRIKELVFRRDKFVAVTLLSICAHHSDACGLDRSTLLLHCILCFCFLGGSVPHEESSLVVNKGEELRLKCNEEGPVTWNFQNSDPSAKTRISNEKEWHTKNATVKDIGRYECKSKGSIVNSFYVFVKDPNVLFLVDSLIYGKEDSDILLVCPLTDPDVLNFTLRKCDGKPLPKNMTFIPNPQKGIIIKNVQRSFKGCYQCLAKHNGVEKISEHIYLNVRPVHKALPVITLSKSYELLKEGEEFEVTCVITDVDSSVKASWISYKSGIVTSKSRNLGDYGYERKLTLNIRSVGVNDSGEFTCQAENPFGKTNATVTLKALAKGFVRLLATMNTTIDINAGQNGNLTVEYEAYPKPKEEVWMYMNETLQNSSDHYVKYKTVGNNSYTSELHLTRLKGTEGGIYTFFVSNSDASSSVTFNVYVKTKPEILTLDILSNDILQCVAAGFPAPTIYWCFCPGTEQRCFDSPTISPLDVKVSYSDSSVPSFERILVESTVNTSMFRNTGIVCCEASSNGERSSAFFNFAIKEQIRTHTLFTPLLIAFGAAAGLMCIIVMILVYIYLQAQESQEASQEVLKTFLHQLNAGEAVWDSKWITSDARGIVASDHQYTDMSCYRV